MLRNLGFIDQSGTPTPAYNLLKSNEKRPAAIAAGVRKAYQPLFEADTNAHTLTGDKLKSLVAQIAGTDVDLTARIANTFLALIRLGDFESIVPEGGADRGKKETKEEDEEDGDGPLRRQKSLRAEFHYNIQVHLPSNGTEETYLNIFNAIRKTFQ